MTDDKPRFTPEELAMRLYINDEECAMLIRRATVDRPLVLPWGDPTGVYVTLKQPWAVKLVLNKRETDKGNLPLYKEE